MSESLRGNLLWGHQVSKKADEFEGGRVGFWFWEARELGRAAFYGVAPVRCSVDAGDGDGDGDRAEEGKEELGKPLDHAELEKRALARMDE